MYALILAGGKGERLRPLTNNLPKPMVEIAGKPILWYQLRWLRHIDVTDIVFMVGYQWQAIENYFGDGSGFGLRIHYSMEKNPLGRGGALRQGLSLIPSNEKIVIATNGDVITTQDLRPMIEIHRNGPQLATLLLTPFLSPYGIVDLDSNNMIRSFKEKVRLPHWVNAGVYVMNRAIESILPKQGDHEVLTFPDLAKQGLLRGHPSETFWCSIDSFKELREAEVNLIQLKSTTPYWTSV